ncbi:hypothetical protein ACHHYP_11787 [Achlya hypogyna]|uniref:Ankyrin repeat protein n=1 Tax=Achlya hypogyna TaxID=1202772 RepID=A0A1V9ZHE6_ACHHY|nr:hypothetical protein ACHHYP_11787 [Achlya hypogyna]
MDHLILQDGATPLYKASRNGHYDVVLLLLDFGANVNQRKRVFASAKQSWRITEGATALYGASKNGHAEVVRLLLDSNADTGVTPLIVASQHGHAAKTQILIYANADIL